MSFSGTATGPEPLSTRRTGTVGTVISNRPSWNCMSTGLPASICINSRRGFGITKRPAPSMVTFMPFRLPSSPPPLSAWISAARPALPTPRSILGAKVIAMHRISVPVVLPTFAKTKPIVGLLLAGFLVLAGCASGNGTSTGPPRQISTVAALEADLEPRLREEFGPAELQCSLGPVLAAGTPAGELQAGNGINCAYMSPSEEFGDEDKAKDWVMVTVVVLVTTPDSYSYTAQSELLKDKKEHANPNPERMYRDGLSCEQLTKRLNSDTIRPIPGYPENRVESEPPLTYLSVVYYWYDSGEPEGMDPDGDGRPCTDHFPEAEVAKVFEDTLPLPKVTTSTAALSGPLTTFDIRKSLEEDLLDDQSIQVDCNLAGPVGIGSFFTCAPATAPSTDGPADHRMVAVVNGDGEFLAIRSSDDSRERGEVTAGYYRPGLTCVQLAAPLNKDTIATGASLSDLPKNLKNEGLSYEEVVLYAYAHQTQGELGGGTTGWPCTDTYPPDEVETVQSSVRTAN